MVFRKFFTWYTRGLAGGRPLRWRAFQAKTKNEMEKIIQEVSLTERDRGCFEQ
jgi:tRNA-dihydrouridine synthase